MYVSTPNYNCTTVSTGRVKAQGGVTLLIRTKLLPTLEARMHVGCAAGSRSYQIVVIFKIYDIYIHVRP